MEDMIFDIIEPAISSAPDLSIGANVTMADIGQCPIPDGSTSGTASKILLDLFKIFL